MLNKKHMPKSYWAEAANTVVYLMNWCTTSRVHEVTPHENYYGKKMDKGKAKMPEYEEDQFDSNESTRSLDNELGGFDVPIMRTPGVKKAISTTNEKLHRSTHEKNPVSRFGYNDYMAYHYVFMIKKAADHELGSFAEPAMGRSNE